MWEYLDLNEEQKHARRTNLDWAGYYVVLSQLLLCGFISVYSWFTKGHTHRKGGVVRALKRMEWRLSNPLSLDHPVLRCLGDWSVVLGWTMWCVFLAISKTGKDYMHVTKAFGIVAVANLPLHFILAMKHSPLGYAYGLSYEGCANFLHRWLGRIIFTLLTVHAILYLNFFWDTSRMKTRFLEFDVLCGFFAFTALTTIVLFANHYVRNISYRTFYLVHTILSPLLFPLMFFHVSHLRPYLYPSIALFVFDHLLRFILSTPATGSIKHLTTGLIEISAYPTYATPIKPGSHAIIRHPETHSWTPNPFSITSAIILSGSERKRIRMVARIRGNFTKKLATLPTFVVDPCSASPNGVKKVLALKLDLPYGAPLYFPNFKNYDKILFVAGGVGATFAVSWVKYLLKSEGDKLPLVKPGQMRFIWAVKRSEDALWAFEDDYRGDNAKDVAKCVEVHITGAPGDPDVVGDMESGMEMTEGLLGSADGDAASGLDHLVKSGVDQERISTGRPWLQKLIRDTVEEAGEGRTAILICGPIMMGSIARRVTARLGMGGADVWLHVEEFGH
ncbi:ferric reductase like transmembrane component-domain-containing protein [Trichophaea hybrida]|nr:ferric reductase like transmembrane component-domain-containing protein [Trichophaea hybrida]